MSNLAAVSCMNRKDGKQFNLAWCIMDMCMVGLKSTRGRPLKKPSELWASSEFLLYHFRRKYCDGSHDHDSIEGGRVAPHKFGPGILLGALQMALKTSFEHMLTESIH